MTSNRKSKGGNRQAAFAPDFDRVPVDGSSSLEDWLNGTYESGWSDLRFAAYSAISAATVGAQEVMELVPRIRKKAPSDVEAAFLVTMNHRIRVFGPAIGAIVSAAFAVESFLQLGYVLARELTAGRLRSQREAGFGDELASHLAAFDGLQSEKRVTALLDITKSGCRGPALRALDHLFTFRNELAHDQPILHSRGSGAVKAPRKGSTNSRQVRTQIGPYEGLRHSDRAVRLHQARSAVAAHDDFVSQVLTRSRLAGWREAMLEVSLFHEYRIQDIGSGKPWAPTMHRLADAWESDFEPHLQMSLADIEDLKASVRRRSAILRIK